MAVDSFVQAAFEQVCEDAKKAEGYYVCLMESHPYYGGPEEGGWWGSDTIVVAYKFFAASEAAEAAKTAVLKLAEEMNQEAKREFGEQCLREMAWCDARGLDYDYWPEPDGESSYYVLVTDGVPEPTYGCRHYE